MPTPITHQAAYRLTVPPASASISKPQASVRFEPISTRRPPARSIRRPIAGPTSAITTSDNENAAKKVAREICKSAAMAVPTIAGK